MYSQTQNFNTKLYEQLQTVMLGGFSTNSRGALSWQCVPLQAWLDGYVALEVPAAPTLDGDLCGLGPNSRSTDHNTGNLHQVGHVLRLQAEREHELILHVGMV